MRGVSSETKETSQEAEQYEGGGMLRDLSTPENEMLAEEINSTLTSAIEALPDDILDAFEGK